MSRYVRIMKTGPVQPLVEKFRFIRRAKPEEYGGSMMKNAMDKVPHVVFICGPYMIATCVVIAWQIYTDKMTDFYTNRPYKWIYTVMRPDDPRVKDIKADCYHRVDTADDLKPRYPESK